VGAGSRARWAVLPAAAGLIGLVALTSRDGLHVPDFGILNATTVLNLAEVIGYVALGVGVFALPVAFAMARARARARRRDAGTSQLEPLPLWLRLLGVYVVLAIIFGQTVVLFWYLGQLDLGQSRLTVDPAQDPFSAGPAESFNVPLDPVPLIIAGVILVAIAALAVVLALRWRDIERAARKTVLDRRQATAEALEVSLDALRREPDPRKAVIAAYAAMEASLSRAGLGRHRSEAPFEYLRRVLDVSGLADDHLRTLTVLFQHAKFSDHPVRESMRTQAIDALGRLRATIGSNA